MSSIIAARQRGAAGCCLKACVDPLASERPVARHRCDVLPVLASRSSATSDGAAASMRRSGRAFRQRSGAARRRNQGPGWLTQIRAARRRNQGTGSRRKVGAPPASAAISDRVPMRLPGALGQRLSMRLLCRPTACEIVMDDPLRLTSKGRHSAPARPWASAALRSLPRRSALYREAFQI